MLLSEFCSALQGFVVSFKPIVLRVNVLFWIDRITLSIVLDHSRQLFREKKLRKSHGTLLAHQTETLLNKVGCLKSKKPDISLRELVETKDNAKERTTIYDIHTGLVFNRWMET